MRKHNTYKALQIATDRTKSRDLPGPEVEAELELKYIVRPLIAGRILQTFLMTRRRQAVHQQYLSAWTAVTKY